MNIQLSGIAPDRNPITLLGSQLIGDRNVLLDQPANVKLVIRPAKRSRSSTSSACASATVPWKVYNGKVFPEGDDNTPTIIADTVYRNFQHALLSFLLWVNGGMTGAISYVTYPRGKHHFPHFSVTDAAAIGITDAAVGALALHLLPVEPSHGVIHQIAEALLSCVEFGDCIILVGNLRPVRMYNGKRHAITTDNPQLRGVRLYRERLPNPLPDVVPCHAVEFGWYPCVQEEGSANGVRIRLAFQGITTDSHQALPPALLPMFPSIGYRVWRKGQNTYAVVPKSQTSPHAGWDDMIRQELQKQNSGAED
jgi:hypothetical protein